MHPKWRGIFAQDKESERYNAGGLRRAENDAALREKTRCDDA
jgi:hypothetical protein